MKIVNWNVEWATAHWRTQEILVRINRHSPEIVCLTETHSGLLPGGHRICSRSDYGYGIQRSRRKVLLWSRQPWEGVDDIGDDRMPPGRFISGVTKTSVGELTVVGLCIPWWGSRAGARYSGERRRAWEDHEDYLEHLVGVLSRAPTRRFVVMGDFNQRIIKTGQRQSDKVAQRAAILRRAIPAHVTLVTSELGTIDHIGLSADMATASLDVISSAHGERKLSDHPFGIVADVFVRGSSLSAANVGRS